MSKVPAGWGVKTLGMICNGKLQTGPFGSQLYSHEYSEVGIPVLMPKDLINCRADLGSAAKIPPERAVDLKKHTLKKGDLLFSRRGDVARFALIEGNSIGALCGTGCLKASPTENYSSEFLMYCLQLDTVKTWLEQNAVGQTMLNMNTSILSELPLFISDNKREQERIAQILSTWDKAIATTEKLIGNSQQQKKALMQSLLTGKKRLPGFEGEFKYLNFSDVVGIDQQNLKNKTADDFSFKYISLTDVKFGAIEKSLEYISFKNAPSRARRILKEGDILLATVRPNLQGFARVKKEHSEMIASTGFSVLSPKKAFCSDYIFHYLYSDNLTAQIDSLVVGSNYPAINSSDVANLKIFCPEYNEQVEIAKVLNNCLDTIENMQKKLAFLKQEKAALMQQLLTGKRRVKVEAA